MTKHLLTSGLIAGLVAGLLAALLQFVFVVPLLLESELYESGVRAHFDAVGGIQSPAGAPSVWADVSRNIGTLAMNAVAYIGFALVLVAGFALAESTGHRVTARTGMIWGLAGFVALHLAPAFSQPPVLPGTVGAALDQRQYWWTACVAATALGLSALSFGRGPLMVLIGLVLIAAPHIFGAPRIDVYFGITPPELAALFTARSLGTAGASWVALGTLAGWLWSRQD